MKVFLQWLIPILLCLGVLAVIIYIILFCFNTTIVIKDAQSDSHVVEILSLLVTLLIGWNIYTVIDFKNSITRATSEMNRSYLESYKCLAEIYNATSNIYSTLKDNIHISDNEKVVRMLFFRMHSLFYFCKIHDIENANDIFYVLNNDMNNLSGKVILSNAYKDAFYEIFSQLKNILTKEQYKSIKEFLTTVETVNDDVYKNQYFTKKLNQQDK